MKRRLPCELPRYSPEREREINHWLEFRRIQARTRMRDSEETVNRGFCGNFSVRLLCDFTLKRENGMELRGEVLMPPSVRGPGGEVSMSVIFAAQLIRGLGQRVCRQGLELARNSLAACGHTDTALHVEGIMAAVRDQAHTVRMFFRHQERVEMRELLRKYEQK